MILFCFFHAVTFSSTALVPLLSIAPLLYSFIDPIAILFDSLSSVLSIATFFTTASLLPLAPLFSNCSLHHFHHHCYFSFFILLSPIRSSLITLWAVETNPV